MVRQKQNRLCVEPLEDRRLLSANVVLEWNQQALQSIGQAQVSPVVASRALAITQAAVYDAVNAIDRSFEPYYAQVHASHGASLEAAANPARTKELYFVADGSGGHVFSETYNEHLKNVAKLRATEQGKTIPDPPPPQAEAPPPEPPPAQPPQAETKPKPPTTNRITKRKPPKTQ